MNKKIYLNDKFIAIGTHELQSSQDQLIKIYDHSEILNEGLKKIIAEFLKETNRHSIHIKSNELDEVLVLLKNLFRYIEAAGGIIQKNNTYLFIHRHGRWDLPKGKLEKGEAITHAAIRECEEECGVRDLVIKKQLSPTFHIYPFKKGYALKQSYWFIMHTDYAGKLIPQTEESIDEVRWCTRQEIDDTILADTYYTIQDVVREALLL